MTLIKMRENAIGWVVCGAAGVSALVSLAVVVAAMPGFFMGDDFELLGDALAGVSAFEPVSTHLRPIVRWHVGAYVFLPYPALFSWASLILHVLACAAVFLAIDTVLATAAAEPLRRGRRVVAGVASLLAFSTLAANEAVFWVSAVGVLYCTIFSCLSLVAFVRRQHVLSVVWLVLAAMSYELWLVLPAVFLLITREWKRLVPSFILAGGYAIAQLTLFGSAGTAYGSFSFVDLPARLAIYVQWLVWPFGGKPSALVALAIVGALGALAFVPRYRIPLAWFMASALLLSLSAQTPQRFFYVPALGLITIVTVAAFHERGVWRYAATAVAVGVALLAPWANRLDAQDYADKSDLHRELFEAVSTQFDRLAEGDTAVLVNRLGPERLLALQTRGRPKLTFVRDPALAGMILPDDAARLALFDRRLMPVPAECGGARIELGRADQVRSQLCFTAVPR